jgi:alpha-ribazole phosphatase
LFSRKADEIAAELRETDFGAFEGKNYGQLNGTKAYQDWIDSNGTLPFPEGEAREDFIERSFKAFREAILKNGSKDKFIFVCHGGSIMSIMMELTGRDYYDFQVHPIGGFELEFEINQLAGDFKDVSYNSLDDRISS